MSADQPNTKADEGKVETSATEEANAVEKASGQADTGGRLATASDQADEAERDSR